MGYVPPKALLEKSLKGKTEKERNEAHKLINDSYQRYKDNMSKGWLGAPLFKAMTRFKKK